MVQYLNVFSGSIERTGRLFIATQFNEIVSEIFQISADIFVEYFGYEYLSVTM